MNDSNRSATSCANGAVPQIEHFLKTAMQGLMSQESVAAAMDQSNPAGRPVVLPSGSLWMAVLMGVLRGLKSLRAVWRLLVAQGYTVGDQAIYNRLEQEGWQPLARLFERVSQILAQWLQPALQAYHQRHAALAPFARDVVALDEMHLDQVKRRLPILRHFKKGDLELLPGKLVALFDVRLQQWRAIAYVEKATQNGREQAKALLSSLRAGTLILADLGYFGFEWFDQLTELGYSWISRVKIYTTVVVEHTYYEAGDTFDRLVWLGARTIHGKYLVRQVQFRQGGQLRQYFTNVCDPTVLPIAEIARLYARRWDIELAFLTLKRELGLHLIWSSKPVVVLAQVWACLIIAQVLQAIRMEVALRAQVDIFEVSLPLLLEALPQFDLPGHDGIVSACVRQGRQLGIIRPSRRLVIEAPAIAPEQLVPLPKDTGLCRQPHYSHKKPVGKHTEPQIEVHPQHDQLVALLMQREAEIKATAARSKARSTSSPPIEATLPTGMRLTPQSAKTSATSQVQPDSSIPRPSWDFLKPLVA
jgi:Transposase DDE domain